MTEWTPDGLRTVPHIWAVSPEMDDLEELIAPYATAWEDARRRAEERYAQLERDFDIMRHAKQSRIEALEKVLRRGRWVYGYMGAEGEVAFLTNAEQLNECEDLVAEDTDVGGFLRWEVEPLTRAEYRATLRSEEE